MGMGMGMRNGNGNMRVFLSGPRDTVQYCIKEYQKGCVALSASSWMNFLLRAPSPYLVHTRTTRRGKRRGNLPVGWEH